MILNSQSDKKKIRSILAHACQLSEIIMPIIGGSQCRKTQEKVNISGGIAKTVEYLSIKCKSLG
jgi:hypothetical protein